MKKKVILSMLIIASLSLTVGCSSNENPEDVEPTEEVEETEVDQEDEIDQEKKEAQVEEPSEELDRKDEIKEVVETKVDEAEFHDIADYQKIKTSGIDINDNLGVDEEGFYLAIINLVIDNKSDVGLPDEIYEEQSKALVDSIVSEEMKDITDISVFWKDKRNNRSMKYSYKLNEDGFSLDDKMEQ